MKNTNKEVREIMNKRKIIGKRKELNFTQAQMAKKLGISENAYREKEKDKRQFTENEIKKISEILKEPITYFF